jgi:hypothetical protein
MAGVAHSANACFVDYISPKLMPVSLGRSGRAAAEHGPDHMLTPIFLPLVQQINGDPVHFGTVFIIAATVGNFTPLWARPCTRCARSSGVQ